MFTNRLLIGLRAWAIGLLATLAACGGGDGISMIPAASYPASRSVAQKGPLLPGSTVTARTLDAALRVVGGPLSFSVDSDLGEFSPAAAFGSRYVALQATGRHFDEVTGAASDAEVALSGLYDLRAGPSLNLNLLTTLASERIRTLVAGSGMTFAAASAQAEREVLAALKIPAVDIGRFAALDLAGGTAGDHLLVAVSSLFTAGRSAAELNRLIGQVQAEIGSQGSLHSPDLRAALDAAAQRLDTAAVAANLERRYAAIGARFDAGELGAWLDQDGDGVIARFEFRVVDASPYSAFTVPAEVVAMAAGRAFSVSAGQWTRNGVPMDGAGLVQAGDVVTVSPRSGDFPAGALSLYLLGGETRMARVSFVWGLQSIEVTPAGPSIAKGLAQQFTATGRFVDGSTADLTRSVRWDSGTPGVAGVNPGTGLAQSLAVGATTIGASSGAVAGSAVLNVTSALLQSLAISPNPAYAGIGIGTQLAATGSYTDGTTADLTDAVAWTAASPAVTLGPRPGRVAGTALANTTVGAGLGTVTAQAPLAIVADTWSPAPSPDGGNFATTATVLADGRVFVTSGTGAAIFDPEANRWSAAAPMPTDHGSGSTATLLADGRVLVVGGRVATAERFDPSSNTWSAAASLSTVRREHTATLLPDGQVLVTGGKDLSGQTGARLSSAERYDPVADRWSPAGSLSTPRNLHTATRLVDGRVLVVGGAQETSADLYDPASNAWSPAGRTRADRYQHTATLLRDGRVLLVGGVRPSWNIVQRSTEEDWASPPELYDPVTDSWASTSVEGARFQHSATLLPDGRVLVAGGGFWYYYQNGPDLTRRSLRSAVLYDPATGTSSPTADMPRESLGHLATPLPGGKTLVLGGHGLETRLVFRDPGLPLLVTSDVPVPVPAFYW